MSEPDNRTDWQKSSTGSKIGTAISGVFWGFFVLLFGAAALFWVFNGS